MAGKFKKGLRCSSTCPTKDHRTFGECMRGKNLNVKPNLMFTSKQKKWDKELDSYAAARRQGVQPTSNLQKDIDHAMKVSDETGVAFQGG